VFSYSRDGKYAATLGTSGDLEAPGGIAIDDAAKKIYVTDSKKHRIAVFSLTDSRLTRTIGGRGIAEEGKFNFPTNLAVDTKGNLYVADTGNFRVQVFDRDGRFVRSIGKLGSLPGFFARPKGVAVDSENHLYVVDAAFQNVQVFDADGRLLLFFGAGGWGPGLFTLPAGIAIDGKDRIYVVDQWPGNVQMFQYLGERTGQETVTR
jgi:DNA-binding beta-propeller fold protein YncE